MYPTGDLEASLIARDVYGELLVPVVTGLPVWCRNVPRTANTGGAATMLLK